MKLIFKKTFGFDFVPTDLTILFLEIRDAKFEVPLRKGTAVVYAAQVGGTELERRAVERYLSSGRRPFTGTLPSLNVEFEWNDRISEELVARRHEPGAADQLVAPYVPRAVAALKLFLEGCQDAKYLTYRRRAQWIEQQVVVPMVTDADLRTFLFYSLDDTFVGSFSEGRVTMSEWSDSGFRTTLQDRLREPLESSLRFARNAWLQFFLEDFPGAVLYAAIASERAMTAIVRAELTKHNVGTRSQIGKIVDDTSNRLLCSAVLGIFGIGNSEIRNKVVALFEIRNALAHGQKHSATMDEARASLETAEEFLDICQAWTSSGNTTTT